MTSERFRTLFLELLTYSEANPKLCSVASADGADWIVVRHDIMIGVSTSMDVFFIKSGTYLAQMRNGHSSSLDAIVNRFELSIGVVATATWKQKTDNGYTKSHISLAIVAAAFVFMNFIYELVMVFKFIEGFLWIAKK